MNKRVMRGRVLDVVFDVFEGEEWVVYIAKSGGNDLKN